MIDRFEQAVYVRRRTDAADRRRIIIQPADLPARRDAEAFGRFNRSTEPVVVSHSDADSPPSRDFLGRTRATIAVHAESLLRPSKVPAQPSEPAACWPALVEAQSRQPGSRGVYRLLQRLPQLVPKQLKGTHDGSSTPV